MSRARDDARRNARGQFATRHADGSPVGARIVAYADGCAEALNEHSDSFAMSHAASHEPYSHKPEHRVLSAPYSYQRWDDLTTDWDEL